jgi:hypothetical protein
VPINRIVLDSTAAVRRFGSRNIVAPLAALLYPFALMGLFNSVQLVRSAANDQMSALGLVALPTSVILVFAVPAVALTIAYATGRIEKPSGSDVLERRLAHLAFASPPLFTLIGVGLYLAHVNNVDHIAWVVIWIAIGLVFLFKPEAAAATAVPRSRSGAAWLPAAHGISAAAILLVFLAAHLVNHMTALWSADTHIAVMKVLRKIYRSPVIEPALVLLMIFQVTTGFVLLTRRSRVVSDFFGTLQSATGAYLAVFITSHLTAVFILGRAVTQVDTDFNFAIGAPAGLAGDPWNVRLIPHYSLAVWCLITHLACGLRAVLLAQRRALETANRIAWSIIALGGIVALAIISGMLGVHLAAA